MKYTKVTGIASRILSEAAAQGLVALLVLTYAEPSLRAVRALTLGSVKSLSLISRSMRSYLVDS